MEESSIEHNNVAICVAARLSIREVVSTLGLKALILVLTFDARYKIVPASSSSLPILCCGTRSRGITPLVDSNIFWTGVVYIATL